MANEWIDPNAPKLGGLNKNQEREVAALVEENFGLNPEWGWKGNIPNIPGAASRIYGMSDEDWDKMLKELPYYGDFQDEDVDSIQEYFLDKYPVEDILSIKIPEVSLPWNWETIGEKYGVGAGVLPSDAAYKKIMSISPDALSGIKVTGLDPQGLKQQVGPEGVPSFDDTGIYPGVPRKGDPDFEEAFWAGMPESFNAAQDTLRHERWLESLSSRERLRLSLGADYLDQLEDKKEQERRDKRSQQKWDAIRRARQYDAIANRLGT